MEINTKAARERFSELLNRIHAGEEITILKHGTPVARMVPPTQEKKPMPSMAAFRQSIKLKGDPLSQTVRQNRDEERY